MRIRCPQCGFLVPAESVNVATDVGVCPGCSEAFRLSAVVVEEPPKDFDLHDPPPGAWFEESGDGWRLGATTRSAIAFFLVPFMLVWSGGSLGGIYGSQIIKGEFNLGMSLFGIPFLIGTVIFGSLAVMTVCGRIEYRVDRDDQGEVFLGAGPIGWRRRFDWASITAIEEQAVNYNSPGNRGVAIALVGRNRLGAGVMVSETRREYLVNGLRALLAERR